MKNNKAITLVALVITIIILLILAGITISQLTGSGLFENARKAESEYDNAQNRENTTIQDYEQWIGNYLENEKVEIPIVEALTSHIPTEITYSWEELEKIAKAISNNEETIKNDTLKIKTTIDGKTYTLGVGDTVKLTYEGTEKTVRVLGFNHDELTDKTAYGETNTYAGISFEFIEMITYARMNSGRTSVGGWQVTELRGKLNNTTINSLSNKEYIKQVNKKYIAVYNDAKSVTSCSDRLWLLSCSEIYDNGYANGKYGYAIAKEGEQYKYYKDIDTIYSTENPQLVKGSSTTCWWLRSPAENGQSFCAITENGKVSYRYAEISSYNGIVSGVFPGFSI